MSKKIELNIKTENGYEVLYPKTDSSNNVVNTEILNKFGLNEGSNVGDVLNELGKYNEYWWEEITPSHNEYTINSSVVESNNGITQYNIYYSTRNEYGYNTYFYYSDSYYITDNGEILLKDKIKMPNFNNTTNIIEYVNENLKGKYIKTNLSGNNYLYYFPENIICGENNTNGLKVWYEDNNDSTSYYVLSMMYKQNNDANIVYANHVNLQKTVVSEEKRYIHSLDINQYLHNKFESYEIQKDYEYQGSEKLKLGTTTGAVVQISSEVELVNDRIQLKQPVTEISVNTGSSGVTNLNTNAPGKYMIPRMPSSSTGYNYPMMLTEICYIPEDAVFSYNSSIFYLTKATSLKIVRKGKYYKFLGKPFENCKKIGNIELLGEFNLPTINQNNQKTYLLNINNDSNYLYYLDYRLDASFSINTDRATLFKNKGLEVKIEDENQALILYLFSSSTTQNTSDNDELPIRYQINKQYYSLLYPFNNIFDLHSSYSNMASKLIPSFSSSATNHTEEIYININNTLHSDNRLILNYEKEHSLKIYRVKLFDF